ncbi:MAG TPA: HAMP domain-containing protein [Candidatus Paenibacillus intestinavium]|nr:HAMP domain-containing protein [Candidatus Paenibacillus intestinavium]
MRTKLMLLLVSILICIFFIVSLREMATFQPVKSSEQYAMISQAIKDEQGSLYTIADSKKFLRKIDASGKLIYSLASEMNQDARHTYMFNDVTTDTYGNAYALLTILDDYGLQVTGEKILKISADGKDQLVIHSEQYDASDSLMRVGRIQNLYIENSELYFFNVQTHATTMFSMNVNSGLLQYPTQVSRFEMPSNHFLKEVTGKPNSPVFYTTKQGFLFSQEGTKSTGLFPAAEADILNFPVEIDLAQNSYIYYLDQHAEAVMRIALDNQQANPEQILSRSQLMQQYEDISWSSFTDLSLDYGNILVTTSEHIIELDSQGQVANIYDGYKYSSMHNVLAVAFWIIAALLLFVVIYTIRFIYRDMMKRQMYLLMKQLLIILPVLLLCMAWLSYTVYQTVSAEKKQDAFKQLKILAANGNYLVDGDELEQLTSPLDYKSSSFVYVKQRLNEVFSLSGEERDGLYNTIYRYMNGKLYIVMDDDDGITMFTPFEITEDNLPVLEKGELVLGEWQDSSGEWMFGLGPIYNSAGEVIGIYETGKDMASITRSNMNLLGKVLEIVAWIGIVLAAIITIMTIYFLASIRKLRRSVNQIASGEWDVNVQITTRDEVAELGDRFNMMAGAIKRYVLEVTKLSNMYFRFVPQQFLEVLGKKKMSDVQLGEQQTRNMTILVCYMRQFNDMSSKLSTAENFIFINSFLKQFGPIIREHGGFISRYLGPGMLTMFPNDTNHSLMAAYHIRRALEEYNQQRTEQGLPSIDIGVAIHAGDVMLGIIGEEQRLEGSVVSNHVQLTLDLERLSEKLGVSVLLTAQAREQLDLARTMQCRSLGWIQLDVDQAPIQLFDWYEGDSIHIRQLKAETKKQFEAAIEAYRNGRFYDAREGFVQVVKRNRYDLIAKLYFFESDRYYQEGAQLNWNAALKIS